MNKLQAKILLRQNPRSAGTGVPKSIDKIWKFPPSQLLP
jgi:hypothetical protein